MTRPKLGESVAEGTIGKWLKKPGDHVDKYEPLLEVITDKVNAEVPSPYEGVLKEILVEEGATVPNNAEIAVIDEGGAGAAAASAPAPAQDVTPAHDTAPAQAASPPSAAAAEPATPSEQAPAAAAAAPAPEQATSSPMSAAAPSAPAATAAPAASG